MDKTLLNLRGYRYKHLFTNILKIRYPKSRNTMFKFHPRCLPLNYLHNKIALCAALINTRSKIRLRHNSFKNGTNPQLWITLIKLKTIKYHHQKTHSQFRTKPNLIFILYFLYELINNYSVRKNYVNFPALWPEETIDFVSDLGIIALIIHYK
ncbi:hypothetical protein ACTFIR_003329 [Dictyostelium discoideum]